MKKKNVILVALMIMASLIAFNVSAGWLENIKNAISGKATQNVDLNISVGIPQITLIINNSIDVSAGPSEAPAITTVVVNFSVYSPSGTGNLNDSTAAVNVTGDVERVNSSCLNYESSTTDVNYSCSIDLQWWDGTGVWNITAYIEDNQSNFATNSSADFYVGSRTAFVMGPSALTWNALSPGTYNQTSNNDPLVLNNTGNAVISTSGITINSSNLRGETTPTEGLWAENFSVSWDTGGSSCTLDGCLECKGSAMSRGDFTAITGANLTKGNYTIDDKSTGQEELYMCLMYAGSELSTQSYSTANETEWAWIVQIL